MEGQAKFPTKRSWGSMSFVHGLMSSLVSKGRALHLCRRKVAAQAEMILRPVSESLERPRGGRFRCVCVCFFHGKGACLLSGYRLPAAQNCT